MLLEAVQGNQSYCEYSLSVYNNSVVAHTVEANIMILFHQMVESGYIDSANNQMVKHSHTDAQINISDWNWFSTCTKIFTVG